MGVGGVCRIGSLICITTAWADAVCRRPGCHEVIALLGMPRSRELRRRQKCAYCGISRLCVTAALRDEEKRAIAEHSHSGGSPSMECDSGSATVAFRGSDTVDGVIVATTAVGFRTARSDRWRA